MSLLASLFLAVAQLTTPVADIPAKELLERCRQMLPAEVELNGRIIVRNRRGIVKSEHTYTYKRAKSELLELKIDGALIERSTKDPFKPLLEGSAVTWSDLSLDYLNWDDVLYDPKLVSESVHGQKCRVIILRNADRVMRVWLDKKTSALLQAEETLSGDDKRVRRLWGTRLKKFGERWAPSVMEVEIVGSGLRTKITIEELK